MNIAVYIKCVFVDVMSKQININMRILPSRWDLHYLCIFTEGAF